MRQIEKYFIINLLVSCKKNLIYFLATSIFLSSCQQEAPLLNLEQRGKIEAFFEELMLEHGGAYTLLGSKPVTIEELVDCSDEARQQFQQYLDAHPEIQAILVDRKLEEGWEEWKKHSGKFSYENFLLTEVDFDGCKLLVFINVEKTVAAISEYHDEFRRVLGRDCDPQEIVFQLRDNKKDLWRQILRDYKTMGILFGYGFKNASLFERKVRGEFAEAPPSENNDPRLKAECYLNSKPFRIPIFVQLDEVESKFLVAKYKKERERIKKIYDGKNFLDVTLAQLRR